MKVPTSQWKLTTFLPVSHTLRVNDQVHPAAYQCKQEFDLSSLVSVHIV